MMYKGNAVTVDTIMARAEKRKVPARKALNGIDIVVDDTIPDNEIRLVSGDSVVKIINIADQDG